MMQEELPIVRLCKGVKNYICSCTNSRSRYGNVWVWLLIILVPIIVVSVHLILLQNFHSKIFVFTTCKLLMIGSLLVIVSYLLMFIGSCRPNNKKFFRWIVVVSLLCSIGVLSASIDKSNSLSGKTIVTKIGINDTYHSEYKDYNDRWYYMDITFNNLEESLELKFDSTYYYTGLKLVYLNYTDNILMWFVDSYGDDSHVYTAKLCTTTECFDILSISDDYNPNELITVNKIKNSFPNYKGPKDYILPLICTFWVLILPITFEIISILLLFITCMLGCCCRPIFEYNRHENIRQRMHSFIRDILIDEVDIVYKPKIEHKIRKVGETTIGETVL